MNYAGQYNEFFLNYLCYIKKLANHFSLTQSQVLCIQSIPYDGILQNHLAQNLSLDISTLSRNLDKLKNMKIINKTPSASDARASIITLTTRGKNFYNQITTMIHNDINKILSNVDINDLEYYIEILNKINWEFELSKNDKNS